MDYKALAEQYKAEIDTFHLFYEDLNKYDLAISIGNGVLADMYSELLKAKKRNPDSKNVTDQEERIKILLGIFEDMLGLNNKAQSLKLRFRHLNNRLSNVEQELNAMKQAYEQS